MIMDQQEKLLSYNGELLIFHLSEETSSHSSETKITKLYVKKMTFDSHTKLFIETSTGSFIKCEEGVEMIHCSCISDFRTGILHPCVVLKKKKRKKTKYMLLFLHNFNTFELILHFKLDYELKEPIKLLSGPTVLWSHAEKLFYISPSTCKIVCAPVQCSSIKWVGEIKGEGAIVLGIKAACFPKDCEQQRVSSSDTFIWGIECFAYVLKKNKVLTNANFLPHAYGGVVSSVQICKAETMRSEFRTSVVAVTCKSQLIFFQDGVLKEVYQLPYVKPSSVQIATVEGDRQLVIVTFASEEVCAIWKHNLQVASCWKNVRFVLVDDFAGIGTEQILILRKADSISESLNTFQVTDFGRVDYVNNVSSENASRFVEDLQENLVRTIRGLEARLQAGFVSVRELQEHLLLKKRVLLKSCQALADFVHDRKHNLRIADKEGLVSLWDETEKAVDNCTSTPPNEQEQFVEEIWYRVMEDNFIVGIKLVEASDVLLRDVSLSLLVGQKHPLVFPIKCRCSIVTLKKPVLASEWHQEPLPKRTKFDYQDKNVCHGRPSQMKADRIKICTAVTHLTSVIALHQVCCAVLLHARKKSCARGDLKNSKKLTLLCGNVLLNLAEISAGNYSVDLRHEKYSGCIKDLAALCAISHKQSFQIASSDCTLSHIKTWLLEQMECVPLTECPDFVVCCKSGNFNGTLFKWKLWTQFKGTLTIFCRHQTILFQCLHSLSGMLPPNCEIKHLRLGSKKVLAEQLALALEREMVSLNHSLSSALSQTKNNMPLNYVENKESISTAGVQHFREAFKKEQQQSMLGLNRKMGGTIYRGLVLNVLELQLNSDKISWQCSSIA